ncbi:MAG TPA: response regulator [Polyangiaceae bacterium]|nr:response regulator [Polyangiaceae bacterium]
MTTTLLGVDDSKTMRKVIEITFAGEDFKTVLAENADDAMSKLSADRPNIVLVDAALEGTNGYDLCQRIKAASPGVGVVLLASKQQPYDRGRGSQVGADDFVDKPFDTQQLIDKVAALARKLAGGTQSHPMATTQHGIGPAAAPAAAPFTAPAAHAPQAVVSARPVSLDVGTRPRSPTLAYGNVNPMAPAGPGPVAPMIPSPAAPAAPRSNPIAAPAPAPAAARPAAPAYSPPSPAAYSAPTPPPPAPPAAAPVAAAAPIAAAAAAVTNGADFATKLGSLGLTKDQIAGVLALSREVVEKVVWEVVPTLAETLIKEEIKRLTAE